MQNKYNVILADPPWKYNEPFRTGNKNKSEDHYPSMTVHELCAMDVASMCEKECVLFMWTTTPQLKTAIMVGELRGFEYKQVAFVWDKERINPGNYTITQCELVLVFRPKKGKLPKRYKTNVRQYFKEKPREHSRKPEYVQDMIELMYPNTKKIELFARRTRDGWDS